MGLSVVAEAARALHGHALMRRRHPWGTEVVIDLPFSATRQNVLLLEAGGHPLALPTHGVERLLRLPEAALQWAEGHLATRIAWGGRDVMLPVTNLASLLGVSGARLPTEAGQLSAVLLRAGERRCLLAVEALSDVRTLPVSAVDAGAGGGWGLDPALVSGLVLPAGSLVPLLRPEGLMDRWLRGMGGTGEGHGAGGDAGGQAAGGRSDRLGLVPRPGAPAGEAEASQIGPGWHGWMHHRVDTPPVDENYKPRDWQKPHVPNQTGTRYAYRPKGSLLNTAERPRVTGDYDAWTP